MPAVIVCRVLSIPRHGSFALRRAAAVVTVNRAGFKRGVSSSHFTGIETGAPSRARGE